MPKNPNAMADLMGDRRGYRSTTHIIVIGIYSYLTPYDLAVTPDGPRGPRYRVQEGIVALSQITGHPIVPVSACIHWKKCFKSWDAFQFPLPFTKCDVRIGEPISMPREANHDERERSRVKLEAQMNAITED